MAKVIINDDGGDQVATFSGDDSASIATQAQDVGVAIPISCGAGACRACVCRVRTGEEFIDSEAIGPQHIETEDGEILSCISAIKSNTPEDAQIELDCENL